MRQLLNVGIRLCVCTALLCSAAWSRPPAPVEAHSETGTLHGAPWRIDLPAVWNGDLVMLAHGFEPVGTPRPQPWPGNKDSEALVQAGYAVAQSGYASQGWAVAEAIDDTERLRRYFVENHPDTQRTWILGFSMGGAVAIATLERLPQHYAGGVALCGANLPGDVLADEMLTSLLAFQYFFPDAAGLPVGGLAAPEVATRPQSDLYQSISAAVQAQPATAAVLAKRLELQTDELAGTISLHTLVFHELVKRSGGLPVGNLDTVYSGFGDDAAFNAGVARVAADPEAQRRLRHDLRLTGALRRPLLLQFNHRDPSVTPRFEPVYPALAAKAGARPAPRKLPATGEGHCAFTAQEVVEAVSMQSREASRAAPAE